MKQFLITIVFFALSLFTAQAQNYNRSDFPTVIIPDSLENYLSMGCGRGGAPSASFVYHRELLLNKDYVTIRKNLFSEVDVVKLLAALTLQYLADNKQVRLKRGHKKQIDLIKKSQNKIEVCIGCTYTEYQSLSSMFPDNEINRASTDFNNWLKSELGDKPDKK